MTGRQKRAGCYLCPEITDERTHHRCVVCMWLISICGACRCYWPQWRQLQQKINDGVLPESVMSDFRAALQERGSPLYTRPLGDQPVGIVLPGEETIVAYGITELEDIYETVLIDHHVQPQPEVSGEVCRSCKQPATYRVRSQVVELDTVTCTEHLKYYLRSDEEKLEVIPIQQASASDVWAYTHSWMS